MDRDVLSRAVNTAAFKKDVKDSKDAGLEPGRGSGYNKILGAAQDSLFAARSQFKRIFGGGQEGALDDLATPTIEAGSAPVVQHTSVTSYKVNLGRPETQVQKELRRALGNTSEGSPAHVHRHYATFEELLADDEDEGEADCGGGYDEAVSAGNRSSVDLSQAGTSSSASSNITAHAANRGSIDLAPSTSSSAAVQAGGSPSRLQQHLQQQQQQQQQNDGKLPLTPRGGRHKRPSRLEAVPGTGGAGGGAGSAQTTPSTSASASTTPTLPQLCRSASSSPSKSGPNSGAGWDSADGGHGSDTMTGSWPVSGQGGRGGGESEAAGVGGGKWHQADEADVQAMAGGVAVDGGGGASGSVVPTLPRLNETPAERAAAEMQELLRYQGNLQADIAHRRSSTTVRRTSALEAMGTGGSQPKWQLTYQHDPYHTRAEAVDATRRSELEKAHLTKLLAGGKAGPSAAQASPVVQRARRLSSVAV